MNYYGFIIIMTDAQLSSGPKLGGLLVFSRGPRGELVYKWAAK